MLKAGSNLLSSSKEDSMGISLQGKIEINVSSFSGKNPEFPVSFRVHLQEESDIHAVINILDRYSIRCRLESSIDIHLMVIDFR